MVIYSIIYEVFNQRYISNSILSRKLKFVFNVQSKNKILTGFINKTKHSDTHGKYISNPLRSLYFTASMQESTLNLDSSQPLICENQGDFEIN